MNLAIFHNIRHLYSFYSSNVLTNTQVVFLGFCVTLLLTNFLGTLLAMPLASLVHIVSKCFLTHCVEKLLLKLHKASSSTS